MNESVTLPLWLFVVLAGLSVWAAGVLLLAPGMRWFFRRRINRVIDDINIRLQLRLPSFKLTRREVLIDRLFHDSKLQAVIEQAARETGEPVVELRRKVDRYAREIVPAFNAWLYFRIGYGLARGLARSLYRVRLGYQDEAGLSNIDAKSSVVFVINHRSNMDYVLVAFMVAERAALSYAVGEWARVWPLQSLVRSMGAYFVRRNSGDALYRAVLARYVHMATEAGVPQAMFPEGGLTIDGALRPPKFGLLDYVVKSWDPAGERDVVFVPVGINYDRVLEDRSQLRKLDPGQRRPGLLRVLATTLRFAARNFVLVLGRRWFRLGYACVSFGSPVSLRGFAGERGADFAKLDEDERRKAVAALGERLMNAIGEVIPVVPVALVAWVFRSAPDQARSEFEVKAAAASLLERWERRGVHVYIPRADRDYAVGVGLRMLALRHIVEETGEGTYRVRPENRPLLDYYANSIAHVAEPAGGAPANVQ
jgi:glycerol-3-phosphate O-acyltransferase